MAGDRKTIMRNGEEGRDCDGNEKGQMTDVLHSSRTRRGSLTLLDLSPNLAFNQIPETGSRIETSSKVKRLSFCV